MKTFVSTALRAHAAGGTLTLAWYWHLVRADGSVYGFTTHVEDVATPSNLNFTGATATGYAYGTVLCISRAGFEPTDVQLTDTLSQNNLDVTSLIGPDGITEEDVRAGKWKAAQIEIGFFNYGALTRTTGLLPVPTDGTNTVIVGTLGDITIGDQTAKTEIRGLSQPLEQNLDGITSETCDAQLGDTRCGVNLTTFARTGTIATVTADRVFTSTVRTEADGWWRKGKAKFTSGAAIGQTVEIKDSTSDGTITLTDEVFPGLAVGDAYSLTPGCNKLLWSADGTPTGDCKVKFDNVRRFRGFKVPGNIAISQYGGQSGT